MINSKDALKKLIDGNKRYYTGNSIMPDLSQGHTKLLYEGQHPHAIILTCSDSRILPGVIFNADLGDIFVVRNAGNVVTDEVMASIDYAINKLKVKLIVILGHSDCGAIKEVLHAKEWPEEKNMKKLFDDIQPCILDLDKNNPESLDIAVRRHVINMASRLHKRYKEDVMVVEAFYSFDNGQVEFHINDAV